MKQRYSSIDVHAIANELIKLVGFRLVNIYEIINHRSFLLKFHSSVESCKEFLHIENGLYCHLTSLVSTTKKKSYTSRTPFLTALKRGLKGKRLTRVQQLGSDRILHFTFGFEDYETHLIAEFYAQGNLILTDRDFKILALLRVPEETASTYSLGSLYPIQSAQVQAELSRDQVLGAYEQSVGKEISLKKFLTLFSGMSSLLAEHWILSAAPALLNSQLSNVSLKELNVLLDWLPNLNVIACQQFSDQKGYLITKDKVPESKRKMTLDPTLLIGKGDEEEKETNKTESENVSWIEYHPFLPRQYAERHYEFPAFSLAVDYFYACLESAKQKSKQQAVESTAMKKLLKFESETRARLQGLEQNIALNQQKAQAIEMNLDQVDQALIVVQLALNAAMDWQQLDALIAEEKKKANPIALLIAKLALDKDQMSLVLDGLVVEIDLTLSAFVNATQYYDRRRALERKREKTIQNSDMALASARQKIEREKKKAQKSAYPGSKDHSSSDLVYLRKPCWFEKFQWFITSDGLLVIAGRNSQQNELLVKKYLKKGDIYIHSEMNGSSSVVIKEACQLRSTANSEDPVHDKAGMTGVRSRDREDEWTDPPLRSLEQAASLCLCTSSAWTSKILSSAYWVRWDQVSKTPPTGMFLAPGSFMIRGKRHFLPPSPLVYGFGFLFKLDPASTKRRAEAKSLSFASSRIENEPQADTSVSHVSNLMETLELQTEATLIDHVQSESVAILHFQDPAPVPKKAAAQQKKIKSAATTADSKQKHKKKNAKQEAGKGKTKERDNAVVKDSSKVSATATKLAHGPLTPTASQNTQMPRGKRGKLKKMKEKYKDQDDEDRILSMKLLGHDVTMTLPPPQEQQDSETESKEQHEPQSPDSIEKQQESSSEQDQMNDMPPLASIKPDSDSDSGSDSDVSEPEEATDAVSRDLLDSLTGSPVEQDVLLYAIPVCGPYGSMARYKYKVKLVPGTLKKGKSTKLALESMLHQPNATLREKSLLKNVKEDQMMLCMLQSVKLASVQVKKPIKKKSKDPMENDLCFDD